MSRPLALLAVALLAGCLAPVVDHPTQAPLAVGSLAGATKPAGALTAPTFKLIGPIARSLQPGVSIYGSGEPGIASSLNGVLYVSFQGCEGWLFYPRQLAA